MAGCGYRTFLVALSCCLPGLAAPFHVYVGAIEPSAVVVAWGTTAGAGNTIGRDSEPQGSAVLHIGDRRIEAKRSWLRVEGLKPDTEYPYELRVNGQRMGGGTVRTWPVQSDRLVFFVMGDYGTGKKPQYRVAAEMIKEFTARQSSGNPVRFVLTTGDNIYADTVAGIPVRNSGDRDVDWEKKFFLPYEELLAHVPFYASPGNHDGNESESHGDLPVYLDNFFFPGGKPARYYKFSFGGLADFFSLDSTENREVGPPEPFYRPDGEESKWLERELAASRATWKIPYFHHPPFTAGPRHPPALDALKHWVDWFQKAGVKVVFNGHEHNFQFTNATETGSITYVVSGSGGELRPKNVRKRLSGSYIAGWSPQNQFLTVEIEGRTLRITPHSWEAVRVLDTAGKPVPMPIVVKN
ncbi:MAG: metallophosphoesterase family protein [Bryobacteraceae bacterium]